MIDLALLRNQPEKIKENIARRNNPEFNQLIEKAIFLDKEWRKKKQEIEVKRHERNQITREIASLKKQGKDVSTLLEKARRLDEKLSKEEKEFKELEKKLKETLMKIPNLLLDDVPIGKDENDNVVIRENLQKELIKKEIPSHGIFLEEKGLANFSQAAKVAGKGFYYLLGKAAILEHALLRLAYDKMLSKGFIPVYVPYMIRKKPYEGMTTYHSFEEMIYKIEDEDLFPIATAEHALGPLHMNQVIEEESLPLKYFAFSPCFRKEIGSHGVDEKGLFRVHQFHKVEQFVFSKPEDSERILQELVSNAEEILQDLELPYRVVLLCSADTGAASAKTYDLEVFSPRENTFKEVGSCSNCLDWQARRLNIKYGKHGGKKEYVHTLNATALATSRIVRLIIENNFVDGKVIIPNALRKYTNFDEI